MKMNNSTYDKIKYVVMFFLPAFTTFVGGLGSALGWSKTELAVSILTLFTTFLGSITLHSSSQYNKEGDE